MEYIDTIVEWAHITAQLFGRDMPESVALARLQSKDVSKYIFIGVLVI